MLPSQPPLPAPRVSFPCVHKPPCPPTRLPACLPARASTRPPVRLLACVSLTRPTACVPPCRGGCSPQLPGGLRFHRRQPLAHCWLLRWLNYLPLSAANRPGRGSCQRCRGGGSNTSSSSRHLQRRERQRHPLRQQQQRERKNGDCMSRSWRASPCLSSYSQQPWLQWRATAVWLPRCSGRGSCCRPSHNSSRPVLPLQLGSRSVLPLQLGSSSLVLLPQLHRLTRIGWRGCRTNFPGCRPGPACLQQPTSLG